MATSNGVSSNGVTISIAPQALSKATTTTAGANSKSAVSTDTKTTATKSVADSTEVKKRIDSSIKEHVTDQPVQTSGFSGSSNNKGEISERVTAAESQGAEVVKKITDAKLTKSQAIEVEQAFDTNLKDAAGKSLTTAQMLELDKMVATFEESGQAASNTATSSTVAASDTSTNYSSLKVSVVFNPSNLGGLEIFLSQPESESESNTKDANVIEMLVPASTNYATSASNASVASLTSTKNTEDATVTKPSTVVDSSQTQSVKGSGTRANSSTVVVIDPNAKSMAA